MSTRIGFIGAGGVNFGCAEGPWDHSSRLEQLALNDDVEDIQVIGIADVDTNRAQNVLDAKHKKFAQSATNIYSNCQIFDSWQNMISHPEINTIVLGTPPSTRGSAQRGHDVELQCIRKGLDMLVEKPLSVEDTSDFLRYAIECNEAQCATQSLRNANRNPIVSVGYMLRYHPAVVKALQIIDGRDILHINMRYQCAYPLIAKQFWWDQSLSGGPIVEQGTHFVDLARYLSGSECRMDTLQSNAVFYGEKKLKKVHSEVNLKEIKANQVNQIITCVQWKSEKDAMVSLSHGVHLHGDQYESYIDLWGDGFTMNIKGLYEEVAELRVRDNQSSDPEAKCTEQVFRFDVNDNDGLYDPYYQQMKCFLMAIQGNGEHNLVQSDYNDAAYTYVLSKDIQDDVMKKAPKNKWASSRL